MDSIGVRELRQHASRYLALVKAGRSVRVTDRGRPVALLVPLTGSRWDELVQQGLVQPPTADLLEVEPVVVAGERPASAVLASMRDGER